MIILKQSCVFCIVNKEEEHISSKAVFLSNDFEAQAHLLVDVHHFKICKAEWEISKSHDDSSLGKGNARELAGAEAYYDIGRVLGQFIDPDGDKRIKALFLECVKSLIQAETYVFTERGYPSEAAYEAYWHKREKNGCRYYSHPNDLSSGWFDYVGSYKRQSNLFNKCKNYKLIENGLDLVLQGTFSDSYHEMNAELCFDKTTGIINRCEVLFFRAPDGICFENSIHGAKFVGRNCYTMTRRQIVEIVGGKQGCYHLADLITDMVNGINDQIITKSVIQCP
jgi:hypothetical protein